MKVLKSIILCAMIGVFVLALLTGCTSKKEANKQLEVRLDFGYNGTIKVSAHNPLVAYIQNKGPAFSGELQIEIEDNMNGKIMFAAPFEMAANSNKEISLEVPLYIIQKKFDVTIAAGKKILFEQTIKSNKILSPNQRVMAVITDTPDAYRFLENTKTNTMMQDPYMEKMAGTQVYEATETEELQVLYFDSFDTLDSLDKLGYFNYIYMGHNQSLTISQEEEKAITEWIEAGNCFVVETGADYLKMNSILPSSLNPLTINETQNVKLTNMWNGMSLDQNIDVAITDSMDKVTSYYQQEGEAIVGAATQVGEGVILTLMVNMGLEPLASWNLKAPLMSDMLQSTGVIGITNYPGNYGSPYQYMLQQVPVEKKTPYMAILIIFMVYILLIAPISYFILKRLDKRDYAWAFIPIMAILCVATLYIFGGNTRYTKAISNSISILTADEQEDNLTISTDMNIFNNRKDNLKVEWNTTENINFSYDQEMAYMGGYYVDPSSTATKKLTGKLTIGNPMIYEKYDAPLWATTYLTAEKIVPFIHTDNLIRMEVNGSEVIIKIKNTTPYTLVNSFIQWGQGYIMVGDLNPGEEKEVTKDFSAFAPVPFETFVQNEMGIKPFDYASKPTSKTMATQRRYDLLLQRYAYNVQYYPGVTTSQGDFNTMKLCAMNTQDIGYDIKVNGDTTENYVTNIIEITTHLQFETGANINIPPSIITPVTNYYLNEDLIEPGNFEFQAYDQYLRLYEEGLAEFAFTVPENIQLSSAKVAFSEVYAEQDYYNQQNGVAATSKAGIFYSVFNFKDNVWEISEMTANLDEKYVSTDGIIKIRVDLRTDAEGQINNPKNGYSYSNMMKLPTISIEGSIK